MQNVPSSTAALCLFIYKQKKIWLLECSFNSNPLVLPKYFQIAADTAARNNNSNTDDNNNQFFSGVYVMCQLCKPLRSRVYYGKQQISMMSPPRHILIGTNTEEGAA